MPFLGKDWRSPGWSWTKTDHGWKRIVFFGHELENNKEIDLEELCSDNNENLFFGEVCELANTKRKKELYNNNTKSQCGGKTFLYFFDHMSSSNPWPVWMGVMHGYEIEFVFGMPLNASLGYTNNERNMTKKFMKHWANFARTGNPGIDGSAWPVFTAEHQEYITLNYNHPEQKRMMRAKECHFWKKLLPRIQKTSDELQSCNASGIIIRCSWLFIILLAISLTC